VPMLLGGHEWWWLVAVDGGVLECPAVLLVVFDRHAPVAPTGESAPAARRHTSHHCSTPCIA
jgi:hypothetical protein